ncbi:zeta toxin family protein [Dactylosporangium sp. NPDC050688]|uniref:zeta toxin family protein n=1 Tax=Dactylosporangium sp. NPDC050688 TaxID=3157217 RepID=UPI0034049E8E
MTTPTAVTSPGTPVRPEKPAMLLTMTGGAGAGKTTLADTLADALAVQGEAVTVLHLDDYYHFTDPTRGSWIPDETGTPRLDVGDPRSIDFAGLDSGVPQAAFPMRVVADDGERVVAWLAPGTQIMYWALPDGSDPRSLPLGSRFSAPLTTAPRLFTPPAQWGPLPLPPDWAS